MLTVKDSHMADNKNRNIETLIQSTTSGHPPELKNLITESMQRNTTPNSVPLSFQLPPINIASFSEEFNNLANELFPDSSYPAFELFEVIFRGLVTDDAWYGVVKDTKLLLNSGSYPLPPTVGNVYQQNVALRFFACLPNWLAPFRKYDPEAKRNPWGIQLTKHRITIENIQRPTELSSFQEIEAEYMDGPVHYTYQGTCYGISLDPETGQIYMSMSTNMTAGKDGRLNYLVGNGGPITFFFIAQHKGLPQWCSKFKAKHSMAIKKLFDSNGAKMMEM